MRTPPQMYLPPALILLRNLRHQESQLNEATSNLALLNSAPSPLPGTPLKVDPASIPNTTPPPTDLPERPGRQSLLKPSIPDGELPVDAKIQTDSRLTQLRSKLGVVKATGRIISTQLACTGFLLLGYVPFVGEDIFPCLCFSWISCG